MKECFISIGGIIIDDIVLPDGTQRLGALGGGLTHAAMGMRVWSENVGIVSGVGYDFDGQFLESLNSVFTMNELIIHKNAPTPRAWQYFEPDGTRNEVFQTDFNQMIDLIPEPTKLPEDFSHLSGVHLHCAPEHVNQWVPVLRERHCEIILWEPWDSFCVPENRSMFQENCRLIDVVSPNLREGRLLTGLDDPEDIVFRLVDYGARVAVLRMADTGSLIADSAGRLIPVPACPPQEIIDVTGAGNGFCGGFVVGLSQTEDLEMAGWYGGVSASLALEQFGALYSVEGIEQKSGLRLNWYLNHKDRK